MSGTAVIGALHVVLSADNDDFDASLDQASEKVGVLEGALDGLFAKMKEVGDKLTLVGTGITAALTASVAAVSATALHTASDFETAMRRVNTALGGVSPETLKALESQARTLGPAMGQGATDAAAGIESLANSGMHSSAIMGGAFAASLKLATIAQTDLAPATDLTSALIRQFSLDVGHLDPIVDKVTGTLLAGHGGLEAYRQAVDSASGEAVNAGVSFNDFNTTVASLGAVLHKGADAGGSFKEFLSKLSDPSDVAKQEMKDLGAAFFDATGKLKPMADVAEVLKQKFAGLNEATRAKVFTEMFGSSGMETAIALMREGKQGFLDLQATIDKASGDKQAALSQDGYAAAVARLSAAFQNLKITIGQAGLVDLFTAIANALTRFVQMLDYAAPVFAKIAAVAAIVVDAMGPLLSIVGVGLYLAFGFWLRSLGPIGWALSALIEPIGTLVAGLRVLTVALLGTETAAAVGGAIMEMLNPILLVASALAVLAYAWWQKRAAEQASIAEQNNLRTTMDGTKPAIDKVSDAIDNLRGKTGQAAVAARDLVDALLKVAEAKLADAKNDAQTRVTKANVARAAWLGAEDTASRFSLERAGLPATDDFLPTLIRNAPGGANGLRDEALRARAEARAANAGVAEAQKALDAQRARLGAAPKPIAYKPPAGDKGGDSGGKAERHGPTPEDLQLAKQIEALQLSGDVAAQQHLQDQLALNKQIEAYQRAGLTLDDARGRAQRDMAAVTKARLVAEQKAITEQERSAAIDIARIDQSFILEDALERQANLQKLIDFYKSQGLTQSVAEARAATEQAKRDEAVARQRKRWVDDDADARALRLAQLRGDSDEEIRQLQRVIDVKKRALELEQNELMTPADATAQANREADQQRSAELQGQFRDIFKGGFKAAMDGDMSSWFTNWWKDRVQKGLEQALNNLADAIAKLFSHSADGSANGSGGLLGAIGGLFGIGGSKPVVLGSPVSGPDSLVGSASALDALSSLEMPAFATGGSFTVGGRSGIDQNLIQFRATRGEMIDIRRPGNDNGGGANVVHQSITMQGGVDLATRSETYRLARATKAATMMAIDDAASRRG